MHFETQNIDPMARTAWIDLPEFGPDAAIEVAYAGEDNSGYLNAMLRLADRRERGKKKSKGRAVVDVGAQFAALVDVRDDDRKLYPTHVIRGWRSIPGRENPEDEALIDVAFTPENVREFCATIPSFLMDRIREGASDVSRFIEYHEAPDPDPGELAEN